VATNSIDDSIVNGLLTPGRQENITKFAKESEPERPEKPMIKPKIPAEVKKPVDEDGLKEAPIEPEEPVEQPRWKSMFDPRSKIDLGSRSISTLKPSTSIDWPSTSKFLILLQERLTRMGFEVMQGVEIPGVDMAARNPESIVARVFFCYMPEFNFNKALELERSIEKFSPEMTVLIGSEEDPDIRLFIVGKNILMVDLETALNTDILGRLEAYL
jgi:hypothetical protein